MNSSNYRRELIRVEITLKLWVSVFLAIKKLNIDMNM